MRDNPRQIALETLLAMEKKEDVHHTLLRDVLDTHDYLDRKDKNFIKTLVSGTLERKITLDQNLDAISKTPMAKCKPFIRVLLEMSAYQILYLDRVPDSAACNEAIKLCKQKGFTNLAGFINGVLRNLSRQKEALLEAPDAATLPADSAEALSFRYACPKWIVEMLLAQYGSPLTSTMLAALLEQHPVSLRFFVTGKALEDLLETMQKRGATVRQSPYTAQVYTLTGQGKISDLPGFAEGAFMVQDVSSYLAVLAAGIKEGDRILDVCAAPGGKAMNAASFAGERGFVLARDLTPGKVALLEENKGRLGFQNMTCQVFDGREVSPDTIEAFDVVLLDVPCSGLGVLGKKRDIKAHISPQQIADLIALSKTLAAAALKALKPGGILLFSTCTINREENEEMVAWLAKNFSLAPVSVLDALPKALLEEKQKAPSTNLSKALDDACLQFYPGIMAADGFFFAKFQKISQEVQ